MAKSSNKTFLYSLTSQLIVAFMVTLLFPMVVATFYAITSFNEYIQGEIERKLQSDLSSASLIYQTKEKELRYLAQFTSMDNTVKVSLQLGLIREQLAGFIERNFKASGVSIFTITDNQGQVVVRATDKESWGDYLTDDEWIKKALEGKVVSGGCAVSSPQLARDKIGQQAEVDLVDGSVLGSGIMIKAAGPVYAGEELVGAVLVGYLLNNDLRLVDEISKVTKVDAIIYYNDIAVSTNFEDKEGRAFLGGRLEPQIKEKVLEKGEVVFERKILGGKECLVAYQPLRDIGGNPIGVISTVASARPMVLMSKTTRINMLLISAIGIILATIIAIFLSRLISGPIHKTVEAMSLAGEGDLSKAIQIKRKDEVGRLGVAFNQMVASLKESRDTLQEWSYTLEQRVEERTKELKAAHEHLVQSAKMAGIGTLAGGVAHEINNPLGTILANTQMLQLNPVDEREEKSLRLIETSVKRCAYIVQTLLKYSRRPPVGEFVPLSLNEVVMDTCNLVEPQFMEEGIQLKNELSFIPMVKGVPTELGQVFTNLILNARDGIIKKKGPGTVKIKTFSRQNYVYAQVKDDGVGISEEILPRIFEPFYTTKDVGRGTGLGLSISHEIIERHNGSIEVESKGGEGAIFTVKLPSRE